MESPIVGVGQTTYRRSHPEMSSRELIWAASKEALDDAGLSIRDIDVVIAGVAPDALAGEASVERSGIMGIGKPYVRVNTGGVTGSSTFFAGASYIKAGRAKAVLVFALERMGQATTSQQVFNTIFDPVYEKDFPLTTITMAALRASMLMRLYGLYGTSLGGDRVEELPERPPQSARPPASRRNARRRPEVAVCSRGQSIATRRARCRKAPVQWFSWPRNRSARGSLSGSRVTPRLGQLCDGRSHSSSRGNACGSLSLRLSAEKAYKEAGVTDPVKEIRVVELYSAFSSAEAMAYPALGLCKAEDGPRFVERQLTDPSLPAFNPSGGPQGANPVSATAMVRIAECALQVRGTAGDRQVDGVERAVATGQGGATQFSTVCVLGKNPVH